MRVEEFLDADALRVAGRADRLDRRLDHGDRVDPLDLEAELAGDDAAHVQQVFDELLLCPALRSMARPASFISSSFMEPSPIN